MKTLKDHTIIYDDECPMCDLYTSAFVKSGMLPENGRTAYGTAPASVSPCPLDWDKARNEIALVNTKTGEVTYGIQSLLRVLGENFPLLRVLSQNITFVWVMKKVYSFISYNRKVIMPGHATGPLACTPSFNFRYRMLYIVFAWVVVSFILNAYSTLLVPAIPRGNFYREFLICGGQVIFQFAALKLVGEKRIMEYLGNMMTVSLAGAGVLLIGLQVRYVVPVPVFFTGFFLATALLMFLEHFRRMKLLKMSPWLTVSWVLYRLIALAAIYVFA